MDNIVFKFTRLLTEGYNFTNTDEVLSALKAKQIGVKTQPEYKDKTKWNYACEKLKIFFKKCDEYGIKDTTYGVQLLLSKVPPTNLENIIRTDGLYELLKSRKKPWVKELKEYQTLMNDDVWLGASVNDLFEFEKAVQNNQSNHGKAAKGSGQIKDVKALYDDGTWKLMVPNSFAGAKAASFYIKDGKETPTEWCTRADGSYYSRYSKNAPLYIIRNMKTGKSYQMAFTKESHWDDNEDHIYVHFLDQNDVKGDEITQGDLSKIPDELLKNIKIPFGKMSGKTMADYKNDPADEDPHKNEKGYTKINKVKWTDEKIIDKKYQRKIAEYLNKKTNKNYSSRFDDRDIVRIETIGGSFETGKTRDALTNYAEGVKKVKHEYAPKAKKFRYYFLGHPTAYVELVASKRANIAPTVNNATVYDDERSILQYTAFYELGYGIPNTLRTAALDPEFSKSKDFKEENNTTYDSKRVLKAASRVYSSQEKAQAYTKKLTEMFSAEAKKLGVKVDILSTINNRKKPKAQLKDERLVKGYDISSNKAPGSNVSFRYENRSGDESGFTLVTKFGKFQKVINVYGREEIPAPILDFAKRYAKAAFNLYRKMFSDEIVRARADGTFSKLYEETNYFPY